MKIKYYKLNTIDNKLVIVDNNFTKYSITYFAWIKDPQIPIIRLDTTDKRKLYGFGDIRKWLEKYDDNDCEDNIVHVIVTDDHINIIFNDKITFCSFKLTFDKGDRIIYQKCL